MLILKIGLLPLYLKLYKDIMPEINFRIIEFIKIIEKEFKERGIDVISSHVCCKHNEFKRAIELFEIQKVDAIVTLHLAYSSSMESAELLSGTKIPIIVLDTTRTYDFGENVNPEEIMYNHGIHGVQDLCNLLLRNNKKFFIEAGHWKHSDVINRVTERIKATFLANAIRNMRVGSIGGYFEGMGDFHIHSDELERTIGIKTITATAKEISNLLPLSDDKYVREEVDSDNNKFQIGKLDKKVYMDSVRTGISIRKWIEKENLEAFTMNFSIMNKDSGFISVPFLEASKAMARGIGYAGEGDVITAALVRTLLLLYPETSFAEMFCPDWKRNRIFLSHMGEVNINLFSTQPKIIEKDLPFLDMKKSIIAVGQLKPGKATLVNISPSRESFTMIVSSVEMVEVKNNKMADVISGWFVPSMPIEDFLTGFSNAGGTHHSALVYGNVKRVVKSFAKILGWRIVEL
jgi:L-arabinose isomerase